MNRPVIGLLKEKSFKQPEYELYRMKKGEWLSAMLTVAVILAVVSFLCYDTLSFILLLSPYAFLYLRRQNAKIVKEKKWKLNLQFADAISCLSSAMESGYSVENAIIEAYSDMKLSYGEDEMIMCELKGIVTKIRNNVSIEEAFLSWGKRSEVEDISSFADIFATAKRTGGNTIGIIRETSSVIRTRVELKRELKTAIASKKYESDIMKIIPFAILAYLRLFSPDMIASLYGNPAGQIFMTAILLVYVVLCTISDRLVDIEL